ncbi:MAG: DNA polymerase III subunit gamma/tau [Verrucomicrobiota bacterium]|nr:DNA polymerase III subunit gamma/tau [Verrucomicrobiota bacterium]
MLYQVLARKYRPQLFEEVVGQDHITRTLSNAIQQNRIANAYLFVGPRGTGKTSTARIFAKALNCEKGPTTHPCNVCPICQDISKGTSFNVLEFDAASNTQVEKIRDIILDTVKYAPTSGLYKVYLIDEVHMLSNHSFNALLKTLEEPPAHVKFIFATTDPQKIPGTILSRCQRFDLKPIPSAQIVQQLKKICAAEKIEIDAAALDAIARGAEGGLRDAESALDQLISFCGSKIVEDDVLRVFGLASHQQIRGLSDALIEGNTSAALERLEEVSVSGKDLSRVLTDLLEHMRHLMLFQVSPDSAKDLSEVEASTLRAQSGLIETDALLRMLDQLILAERNMKNALSKKIYFEMALVKASRVRDDASIDVVIKHLRALQQGQPVSEPAPKTSAAAPTPAAQRPAPRPATQPSSPANPGPSSTPVATPEQAPTIEVPVTKDAASAWKFIIDTARIERALIVSPLLAGRPMSLEKNELKVGFPSESSFQMESLLLTPKNKDFLTELLSRFMGTPAILRLEVDSSIPAPPPKEGKEVQPSAPTSTQVSVKKPEPQKPAPTARPPSSSSDKTASGTKPEFAKEFIGENDLPAPLPKKSEEELMNDPLIKQALELFKGRIVEVRTPKEQQ